MRFAAKYRVALAFGAALGLLSPHGASAQAPEKRKVNIATASLGLPYLPLIIAQQRRYFTDEGLDVEIAAFAGGSKALQSLMGGSSDVASGAYSNTLTMAAKGQKLKNFVVQVRYPALTIAVSKKVGDRYKSPADLKGMKIGVSAPGSSTHMIVNHLLGKAGLTSNDVSIIGVGTSGAAVAAIEKGEIDAIINSDPVMTKLETDKAITIIAETRTRKGTEDLFGGPYPEAGLYATAEFIEKNPNTIQALTNAIVRAELWMQKATVDDIAANVPPEHMLGDKELYLASYKKMREAHAPDGQITKEGAQIVLNVLAAFLPEVKAANIKVEDTYDNRFVEAALKKWQGKM
ncbi:MAG: transporter substrate-binding domain-containing protein [Alphaproteobacteria bacterium]|nr:MAG: transporter substrate-binding domain-containing protein [Alphaproteobacteria bacterium]